MTRIKERKERLSIYLVKSNAPDHDLIKLENAKPVVELPIEGVDGSRLYVKKEPPLRTPSGQIYFWSMIVVLMIFLVVVLRSALCM